MSGVLNTLKHSNIYAAWLTLALRRLRVISAGFGAHDLFFSDQGVSLVAQVLDGFSILWRVSGTPQAPAVGHLTGLVTCHN